MEKKVASGMMTILFLVSMVLGIEPAVCSSTIVYVDPPSIVDQNLAPCSSFKVNINISDVVDLFGWQVVMSFNPNVLQAINITIGDFLATQPEGTYSPPPYVNNTHGWVAFGETSLGRWPGVNGSGWLGTIEFHVVGTGETVLNITDPVETWPGHYYGCLLLDSTWPDPEDIPFETEDGYFNNLRAEPPSTIDELKTEIEKCGSEGEIDNKGIVKSLVAKLNVAQKLIDKGKINEAKRILEDDFIPQVHDLSGIHITVEAAEILIESAEYILSNL